MKTVLRIGWLAVFLMAYAVLVSLQFMWLPEGSEVLGFVRIWLPLSGTMIFLLAYFLPREPAVWAAPLVAYLVPAAWYRQAEFVDPAGVAVLIAGSAVSAWVFRRYLAD